jgi:DNA-binding MarR family transcriptional regulator
MRKAGYRAKEVADELGLTQSQVEHIYEPLVKSGELIRRRNPGSLNSKVIELAKTGMTSKQIYEHLGPECTTIRSVYQMVSFARRNGQIPVEEVTTSGHKPKASLLILLDKPTRVLLDAEAEDANLEPNDIAKKIITRVLNDQELIERVLEAA